jgi:hypothetical protein
MCLTSNQVSLCQPKQRKAVEDELERSLLLLDLLSAMQESKLEHSGGAIDYQKGRHCSSWSQDSVSILNLLCKEDADSCRRFKKINSKSTSANQESCRVVKLLGEAHIAVSILESSSHSCQSRLQQSSSKWSFIHKTFLKRRVLCEVDQLQA